MCLIVSYGESRTLSPLSYITRVVHTAFNISFTTLMEGKERIVQM